jgi:RluA family pseudouridine synthase
MEFAFTLPILFEDDDLLIINKPAGVVVNRSHTYSEPTIQDWMADRLGLTPQASGQPKTPGTQTFPLIDRDHSFMTDQPGYQASREMKEEGSDAYGTPEEIFAERLGMVHRLDKDTSGVMILAKNPTTLMELLRQFKQREVEKTYLALVHGKLVPSEGTIRLPMGRSSEDRKKFSVSVDGKMSETHFQVIEHYPGLPKLIAPKKGKSYQGFSLVELTPKTGRTHQIRVHMSAIKHPLVGDSGYAGKKRITLDKEWCPRQFLHAKKLCVTHPTTKERLCVDAPLAPDLQAALDLFSR